MAGAGYKLFNTGDVLTAAQVNTYLQEQTVMVFANSTARTTALSGVLAEGMVSYLQDTNAVEVYNGSAWVGLAADQTPLTTKGDLFTFTTVDARLGVGTDGQYLQADSTTATGLKWASVASGGTFVGCQLEVANGTQTITNNTDTVLECPSELIDTDGFHSNTTNNGRITIPTGKGGKYLISGYIVFPVNSSGNRRLKIRKNGSVEQRSYSTIVGPTTAFQAVYNVAIHDLAATDYVEMVAFQDSGSSLTLNGNGGFSAQFLGA